MARSSESFSACMVIRLKSICIFALLLLLLCATAVSQSIVERLPGFPGPLPFKLETGYIGVGEEDEGQLFYYFMESEGDAEKDPLVLWITGGLGCSALSALVYEIGPLNFDSEAPDPSFVLNQYSWTKVANIIFVDSTPGTGFSYATTSKGYDNSDIKVVQQIYIFLQKWLLKHPNFIKNRLYISGDSYGAMWIPMIVQTISKGNEAGDMPHMDIKGYSIGNPIADSFNDINSRVEFAHRLGLISDDYYEMAKESCKGNYINPNSENVQCLNALKHYTECTQNINMDFILGACYTKAPWQEELKFGRRSLGDDSLKRQQSLCRHFDRLSPTWANDLIVQEALQVRKGTISKWEVCNITLQFTKDVKSVISYHQLLSKESYQVLVYSGDHDMNVPYIGTLEWINQLNLTLVDDWRPWLVGDQVAGYTQRYVNKGSDYSLTFATVLGAGHMAPKYKRKECLAMFKQFLSHDPL